MSDNVIDQHIETIRRAVDAIEKEVPCEQKEAFAAARKVVPNGDQLPASEVLDGLVREVLHLRILHRDMKALAGRLNLHMPADVTPGVLAGLIGREADRLNNELRDTVDLLHKLKLEINSMPERWYSGPELVRQVSENVHTLLSRRNRLERSIQKIQETVSDV